MQGPFLRKYGVQTTIDFMLFKLDGSALKTDAAFAAGDVTIMKDEGAEAPTTNGFTDEGKTYSIVLTAAEMQAARIVLIIVDQSCPQVWFDTTIVIETYGDLSAQHALDLDSPSAVPGILPVGGTFNPHYGTNQAAVTGGVSASVAISSQDKAIRLINSGANTVYVRVGAGSATAIAADLPIVSGAELVIVKGDGQNVIAYISPDGASALDVQTGEVVFN